MTNRKNQAKKTATPPVARALNGRPEKLYHVQITHQRTARLKPFGQVVIWLAAGGNPLVDKRLEFDFEEIELAIRLLTDARRRIAQLRA